MQKTKPLISIIVPVYNAEKYLRKCIDSIVNQTYTNLEIILVDDGSPDNSGAICDEYAKNDSRIKVIHKPNGGLSSARNAGLDLSSGEYLTFIDSDDYIELDTVEQVVKTLLDREVEVVLIREKQVNENGETTKIVGETPTDTIFYKEKEFLADLILAKQINGACDKFYKRELLNGLRFEENKHHGEDMLFNVCYLEKVNTVGYVDSIKYSYVANQNSITHSKFNSHSVDSLYFKDKVYEIAKEKFPKYSGILSRRCFVARLTLLRLIFDSKEQKNQAELLGEIESYLKDKYKLVKKHLSKKERLEYLLFKGLKPVYFLYLKYIKAYKNKKGI